VTRKAFSLLALSTKPGLLGESPLLGALAHWTCTTPEVFDVVCELLKQTWTEGGVRIECEKDVDTVLSFKEDTATSKEGTKSEPLNPLPKTKAEKRAAAKLLAEQEADKRERDAIAAVVGGAAFPKRGLGLSSNGTDGTEPEPEPESVPDGVETKLSLRQRKLALAPLLLIAASLPSSSEKSAALREMLETFFSDALDDGDELALAVLKNTRRYVLGLSQILTLCSHTRTRRDVLPLPIVQSNYSYTLRKTDTFL
tara:strand:+ start:939 stop:1703 length:765 start_codon:yes stop_codon:yes gene_type:complete